MKLYKSPLRFVGGKQLVSLDIVRMLPPCSEFREPFFGGGSTTLMVRQLRPRVKCWVNELYSPNYAFWAEIQRDSEGLMRLAALRALAHIEEFKKSGTKLTRGIVSDAIAEGAGATEGLTEAQIHALVWFVTSRTSYSGVGDCGGVGHGERFTRASCDTLISTHELMRPVKFTNLDFSEAMHVPRSKRKKTVIYLDPPYHLPVEQGRGLYGKGGDLHRAFNFDLFYSLLHKLQCIWFLTIDACERSRYELSRYHTFEKSLFYGSKRKRATELWATNDPLFPRMQQLDLWGAIA